MNNKVLIAIIAAVAVVAIVAAAVLLMGNGNNNSGPSTPDTPDTPVSDKVVDGSLWVLGNANNDTTIDNKDVTYIQNKIRDGGLTSEDRLWCDANYDGKVDQSDVDFVKKLIAGTSSTIYYRNYNGYDGATDTVKGSVVKFNVPDASKPIYLMLEGRCLAEEVLVVTSQNHDHYKVVAASKQCMDYNGQLQFFDESYTKKYGIEVMMTTNRNISPEEVATLEKKYNDGMLIMCMGAEDLYNKGIEEKISGYGTTQVIRLPSWEHGLCLSGTLTFGYLLGSQGNISGKSSWQMANEYADWNIKYSNIIIDATKNLTASQRKTIANFTVSESSDGVFTYSVSTAGGDPYNYSTKAGGNNLGSRFAGTDSNGSKSVTVEDIAQYARNVDVIVLQTAGEAFDSVGGPQRSVNTVNMGVRALNGYVTPNADIYSMSFAFFNGASHIISMVLYAQFMYGDTIKEIGDLDYKAIYKEYCKFTGWEDRDFGYLVIYSGPRHTTTPI